MNDDLLAQREQGDLPFDLPVLTVPRRRSGEPRATPLTVYETDGVGFVLGGFPAADWIRNVRAADGHATLSARADAPAEPVVPVELVGICPVFRVDRADLTRQWRRSRPQAGPRRPNHVSHRCASGKLRSPAGTLEPDRATWRGHVVGLVQ